jgi:hydrogenase/urease accessory protein HupE
VIRSLLLLFALFAASPVAADDLRPGYLEFSQEDARTWRLVWKIPARSGIPASARPLLPDGCAFAGDPVRIAAAASLTVRWRATCGKPAPGGSIGLSGFSSSRSDVLTRVAPLGGHVQAFRLTADNPTAAIATRPGRWQIAGTYFATGVEHILTGYDHLLFVIALVLLIARLVEVAKAVTAFTLAHSLTLAATTLGFFGLPQRPVESAIALSILFLAVELAKESPRETSLTQRFPWVIAFAFGLLHGLGFAGALREIGLPEGDVATALVAFNLGVEAGQLGVVVATIAALAAVRRAGARLAVAPVKLAAYGIGSVSSLWLIERSI